MVETRTTGWVWLALLLGLVGHAAMLITMTSVTIGCVLLTRETHCQDLREQTKST